MGRGLIERDHLEDHPLNRIKELEDRVASLERALATCVRADAAGTDGATEQGWIEVVDADGNTGYVRVYGGK